jgi:hypothetical protein
MKKLLLLLLCLPLILSLGSCGRDKDKDHDADKDRGHVQGVSISNVHAPTSGSDSIKFTPDSANLHILLFCPLGGINHVVIHDMTTGIDFFNGNATTTEQVFSGLIAGDSYAIICFSGPGTTNFSNASSSFRNSGQSPSPFSGYTQYFTSSSGPGPTDGVVIILMDEPASSTPHGK